MKNVLLSSLILFPLILSGKSNYIQDNIIKTSGDGKSNVIELDGAFPKKEKEKTYSYEKEILLNYYLKRQNVAFNSLEGQKRTFIVAKDKDKYKDQQDEDIIDNLISVKGYCIIEDTVDIGKQPMSANLNCNTNIGPIKFFGNYVPHNQMETLFVTGLHIEKNDKKYKIENAKILNENRSSYNVATYVNNRKLEKISLDSTSKGAMAVKEGANDYLEQLEQSKVVEQASVGQSSIDNSGDGTVIAQPVVTRNTQPPEAKDYLVKGAIDIITGTVKAVADVYKADLPYLYQIVEGSKIYVDLYVNSAEMTYDNTTSNNINNKNYTTKSKEK